MIKTMLAATVITMMCGCSSEESLSGSSDAPRLTLSVRDQGFASADGAKTRTTDEGTATSFSANDAIGIYITDGTNVKFANLKYTFDGTNWTNSAYGTALPYIASGKYFAYYPYQDTYNASNVTAAATTADDFFATMISGWTPAADQSTHDKYTAQDLMTAIGSVSNYQFTFDMTHQMALAEMDFPQITYWKSTGVSTGTTGEKYRFNVYTPYNIGDGQYRLIINPATTTSVSGTIYGDPTNLLGSWSIDSPAKSYIKTFKVNGKSPSLISCIPAVGSIYYSDGTCANKLIDGKTPIGVVVSTNSTYCEPDQTNNQYGHGLVMALKNASRSAVWGPLNTDEKLLNKGNLAACYNDASGLANTNTIYNAHSSTLQSDYPAFYAAINYKNTVAFPSSSSGWFLPSLGQWWDTLEKVAAAKNYTLKLPNYHTSNDASYTGIGEINIIYALNGICSNLPHDIFQSGLNLGYWSSTEYDSNTAYFICFSYSPDLKLIAYHKSYSYLVRAFLAF